MKNYRFEKDKIYYHKRGIKPFYIRHIDKDNWATCFYFESEKTYLNKAEMISGLEEVENLYSEDLWE